MIFHSKLIIISAIIISTVASLRSDPLVKTNVGLIKGLLSDDGTYSMFLGIPYGVVNRANPFGLSTPHPGFEEPFEAYDDSTICIQWNSRNRTAVGSIDCLQLNVFVPISANHGQPLPVLVFIHGGGFTGNSKSMQMFGPGFFMKQNIILVTLNYRLGAYGFMCLDIPEIPGNQGLKDQRLALKWVKDNIAAFGGNVNKITLSGTSAGSMSTNMHVLFNKENLFNQAIMQSGTSFCPVMYEPIKDLPIRIAANLNFHTTDIYEAIEYLAGADSEQVILGYNALGVKQRVCIENNFNNTEGYILENWLTADTNPAIEGMPILIGFNEEEKGTSNYWNQSPEFFENLQLVNTYINNSFAFNQEELEEMKSIINNFYFGDNGESVETAQGLTDFNSDFIFNHATYRSVSNLIKNKVGNIYLYLFSYVGERSSFGLLQSLDENRKAVHHDENLFLYDRQGLPEISNEDQLAIDRMTMLWANFVKYGDPTPETSDLLPIKWQPNTENSVCHYLNIGRNLTAGTRPLNDRMTFWDLFYHKNGHLTTPYPNID